MMEKRIAAGLVLAVAATVGWAEVVAPPARAGGPGEAIYGDVDGDGFRDRVYLGNVQPDSCAVIVEYGRPQGVLLPPTAYTYLRPGGSGPDIACPDLGVAVDLNRDGTDELVIAWSVGPPPTLMYNLRVLNNQFRPAFGLTEAIRAPQYMGTADFNGDGYLDVYSTSDAEGFESYYSLGDGTLTPGPKAWCSSGQLDYLLYDWNRDGAVATVVAYTDGCEDGSNGVVRITGSGNRQFLQHDPTGTRTWRVQVAFANGDSWADIRTVSDTGEVDYFIQPPGGGTFVKSPTANHDRVTVGARAVEIPVLANDYVTTSARLTIVEPPRYGTAQVTSRRTVVYRPDPDHRATDRFVYRVTEGTRTSNAAVNIRFTG